MTFEAGQSMKQVKCIITYGVLGKSLEWCSPWVSFELNAWGVPGGEGVGRG